MDHLLMNQATTARAGAERDAAVPSSRATLWAARGLSGLLVAFLLADAGGKLVAAAVVVEATQRLGYSLGVIRPLGAVLAASTLLYAVPRTQFFGAILLTAYLGGATATLVRVGTPFWFPVMMGSLLWVAYFMRNPELRRLLFPTPQR